MLFNLKIIFCHHYQVKLHCNKKGILYFQGVLAVVSSRNVFQRIDQLTSPLMGWLLIVMTILSLCSPGALWLCFHLSCYTIAHRLDVISAILAQRNVVDNRSVVTPEDNHQNLWGIRWRDLII